MEIEKLRILKYSMEKYEAVKEYLTKEGIEYWTEVHVGKTGIVLPLYIPRYRIAVHVGDDTQWYNCVKRTTHPVFIREEDTIGFVIEKVQNTIRRIKEGWKKSKSRRNNYTTSNQRKMARRKAMCNKAFQSSLRAESKNGVKSTKSHQSIKI